MYDASSKRTLDFWLPCMAQTRACLRTLRQQQLHCTESSRERNGKKRNAYKTFKLRRFNKSNI